MSAVVFAQDPPPVEKVTPTTEPAKPLVKPRPGQAQGKPGAKVEIRGTVVDEQGRPVAGATVSGVLSVVRRQGQFATVTGGSIKDQTADDQGNFTVEVPAGDADTTVNVTLRARHQDAFTEKPIPVEGESGGQKGQTVMLKISPKHARAISVRALDEDGKPVAGTAVAIHHQPSGSASFNPLGTPVKVGETEKGTTDAKGKLETPRAFDPDGSYRLELSAEGFMTEKTPWKNMGDTSALAFGDIVLRKTRTLEGRVIDRQGKPVAKVRVVRADARQRAETTTDADGRFKVETTFFPPGFVFAEKEGYRFHGQRCDKPESLQVTLTRRAEPGATRLTTLPPALSRAERKEFAAQLVEPILKGVLEKAKDDDRLRPLETLARIDPGRLLEELEKRPLQGPQSAWFDSYLRRAAAKAVAKESPDEARSIIDSMKDAGFRSTGYVDLHDALPAKKRSEKLAHLNQALLHSQSMTENDHRIIQLAWVAKRLWELGEKERATKLLRDGQAIAKELPTAAWAGYARGAFAEDLALIDLAGALALMKDLKDPFEYVRHHGNLAHKLAGADPAGAERVLDLVRQFNDAQRPHMLDQYAIRVCHRMAPVDLSRARKIAEAIHDPLHKARAFGVMAEALANTKPKEALELLDHAFDLLAKHVAAGQDHFNSLYNAASVAGITMSTAERIDPALVPEFFWRTVALHWHRRGPEVGAEPQPHRAELDAGALGALALVLARYDHGMAMAFAEEAAKPAGGDGYGRSQHMLAAAIANPRRAVELAEKLPEGQNKPYAVQSVIGMLLHEGDEVWKAVHRTLGQWHVEDED